MRKVIARSLFAVLALLALTVAPASAENVHVPTGTLTGPNGNPLVEPIGVAVDNSTGPHAGDVYVLDNGAGKVVAFTAAGAFRTSWGKNVNEGTGDPNICSSAGAPENICKPGEFQFGNTPYQIGNAFSAAVDSTSGPSQGDVYVAANSLVVKYDPTGHVVTTFGGSPFAGGIQVPNFNNPSIAVDSTGVLYLLVENTLTKYSENGVLLETVTLPFGASVGGARGSLAVEPSGDFYLEATGEFGSPGPVKKVSSTGVELGQVTLGSGENHGLAYDPAADELLAVYQQYPTGSVRAFRFNGSDEVLQPGGGACALSPSGCAASEEFANEGELNSFNGGAAGLAVSSNHTLYVADTYNHIVRAYRLIDVPKLTTGATENVTRTSAKFLGHVDPDGAGQVTTCKFEYGTTKAYGLGSVPCNPPTTSAATDVSAELPAETLKAETLYHYRLVAGNANGNRPGVDMTVETLDSVGGTTTEPAENVGRITATFKGAFLGDGLDTSYYFEYGQTNKYGQKTLDVDHGTATGLQKVSTNVVGLYSYYPYHYRFVAHNSFGTTFGPDQTFHTEAPDPPAVEKTFASDVDQDSATLNAQVDPGEGLTVYRFEFGTTPSFGSRTLVAGPIDPESSSHTASTELESLLPGTTYYYRAVLTNFSGTVVGSTESFTTPQAPDIESTSASAVTRTSATLDALINPGLSLTTYHFDYGTTIAYGQSTPESAPVGPDDTGHAIGVALTGLTPGTTYHFRAVATNPIGTTVGPDQTFTTRPPEEVKREEPTKCKNGFVKKHGKCVKKHHKKHHRHRGSKRG